MRTIALLIGLLACAAAHAQGQRFYVNAAAQSGGGTSWADAFNSLHDALALAAAGDEVWVAQGTYKPSQTGNRALRFEPLSGLRLYGGFEGWETTLAQRPSGARSVLSGDIGAESDSTDNSYTIMYLYHPDSTTLIDGFVFRDALADKPGAVQGTPGASGAALFIDGAGGVAYPLFRNCLFEHNTARSDGGAVYVDGSGGGSVSPGFVSCGFVDNRSTAGKGGAYSKNASSWWDRPVDFDSCYVERNYSGTFGGTFHFLDDLKTDSTQFQHCRIDIYGSQYAGGLIDYNTLRTSTYSCVSFFDTKFIRTATEPLSTSIFLHNLFSEANFYLKFQNCSFSGILNEMVYAAAFGKIKFDMSDCRIHPGSAVVISIGIDGADLQDDIYQINNISIDSAAFGIGSSYSLNITNLLVENSPKFGIGSGKNLSFSNAVFFYNNFSLSSTMCNNIFTLKNCVFTNNTYRRNFFGGKTIIVENTIFQNDHTLDYQLPDGSWYIQPRLLWGEAQAPGIDSVVFRHSLIADYGPAESMSYHRGNYDAGALFDTDPGFLDPAGHNLRPAACSPLINAGLNAALPAGLTSDLDGAPRIRENIVDIGPYESNYALKIDTVTATPTCAGIDSGAVSWSMQGGCPPLAFTWIHESGESGTSAVGLAPGLYRFHIADAAGRADSFQIEIPGYRPSVALSGDTLLCAGETGGTLNASVSGGLEPVQYWWSDNTAAGPSAGNLSPGIYTLTVVDAWGCSDSATAQVTEVPAPQLDYALNHAGAPDIADGSILVVPSGGLPPFSFLWENGDTSAARTELLPGAYQLLLFDGVGCNYGYVFEIGVSPATEPGNDFEQPSVHPNPAAQQIELNWAGAEQFRITDALGRIIIQVNRSTGEKTVRIDALPDGAYYYEFRYSGRSMKRGTLLILH